MNRSLLQLVVRGVEVQAAEGPRGLGDAELLRRFAETRDESAFNVLVARHGPLVWAVCRDLLPNESDAEDAFQATFLALVQSARRVRTPAVGAWLHGVAVRVARMAKRSAGRRRRRERESATTEARTPVADAAWDELQAAVHEEVGRLPEALRVAFVLCGLQGKSQRDVAAELGWKPGTLSGRLTKARQQVLERLSKRGVAAGSVVAACVGGGAASCAAAPAGLVAKVALLASGGLQPGNLASPALLELARAATEVSMTRTKLLGLALGLAGILMLGATLLPLVGAQEKPGSNLYPGGGSSPGMQPGGAPGNARTSITAAWEYKYVIRRSNRLEEFQKALASYAGDGWEYVGTESDLGADGGPVMVFKRPAAHGRNAPGGGMPGMMGPGVGGPGIGGPSMGMPGLGAPGMGGGLLGGSGLGGGALGIGGGFAGNPGGGQNSKATQKSGGIQGFSGGAPMGGAMKPGSLGKDQGIATGRDVQIIALRNASAVSLAKSLLELFGDGTARIVAEQQTNSLLVQADAETYQLIVKLVERLDVMPKRQ